MSIDWRTLISHNAPGGSAWAQGGDRPVPAEGRPERWAVGEENVRFAIPCAGRKEKALRTCFITRSVDRKTHVSVIFGSSHMQPCASATGACQPEKVSVQIIFPFVLCLPMLACSFEKGKPSMWLANTY